MRRDHASLVCARLVALSLAAGALGCWFDVPDLRAASGAGAGAGGSSSGSGAGGGSGCSGPSPVTAAVGTAIAGFNLAAADDGVVVSGSLLSDLKCGATTLTKPQTTSSAAFLGHLDEAGHCTWAVEVEEPGFPGFVMAIDAAGATHAIGGIGAESRVDGVTPPTQTAASFVIKLDEQGSSKPGHGWLVFLDGGSTLVEAFVVAATPEGDTLVAGHFLHGPWDTGVGVLQGNTFVMRLGSSGSPVWAVDAVGTPTRRPRGGQQVWANTLGGDTSVLIHGGALDADGDVLLVGSFGSKFIADSGELKPVQEENVFLAKLDGSSGKVKWAKNLGGTATGQTFGLDIAFDKSGQRAWIAATQFDPLNLGCGVIEPIGAGDVLLAEMTTDGDPLSVWRYGSSNAEQVFGISRSPSGVLRVTGAIGALDAIDFGTVTVKSGPGFIATLGVH
jgi:hypothetical protein